MRSPPVAAGCLACLACLVGLAGCTAEVSSTPAAPPPPPPPVVGNGLLVVDWSIAGTKDPNACTQSAAATIAVNVTLDTGQPVAGYQQACTTFATSIGLAPGRYAATALLLDAAGTPRTTAVPIHAFTILGNDTLNIPIDFPASSFY
jgi:hypothetical protein